MNLVRICIEVLPYDTLGIIVCKLVSIDNNIMVKFVILLALILFVLENVWVFYKFYYNSFIN